MELRLYQAQTNALNASENNGFRLHAGDWIIQRQTEEGDWRNFDGPYAPHEKATAQARLKQLQDAELPQIFDDEQKGGA